MDNKYKENILAKKQIFYTKMTMFGGILIFLGLPSVAMLETAKLLAISFILFIFAVFQSMRYSMKRSAIALSDLVETSERFAKREKDNGNYFFSFVFKGTVPLVATGITTVIIIIATLLVV